MPSNDTRYILYTPETNIQEVEEQADRPQYTGRTSVNGFIGRRGTFVDKKRKKKTYTKQLGLLGVRGSFELQGKGLYDTQAT